MLILRITPAQAVRDYVSSFNQLKWAVLTVAAVLPAAIVAIAEIISDSALLKVISFAAAL